MIHELHITPSAPRRTLASASSVDESPLPTKCESGTLVAERFRMLRELSGGAMGSVWLAHDVRLDTQCALKLVHTDLAERHDIRARFEREAKAAAQIRSAHVVQILDYGVWNDLQYIAMELLRGETLEERLIKCGRLSAEETVRIVLQVARALTKAHAAGLVHRDLTPGNIFLVQEDDEEIAKVLDFGIVKSHLPVLTGTVTQTGALIGTPIYMSPEQAQGLTSIDYRSDLWSLAVIAFRCVTGWLPFDSEALGDLLVQIIIGELPTPSQFASSVPPTFDAWWARATVRDPSRRFQSARELADTLAIALGVSTVALGDITYSLRIDTRGALSVVAPVAVADDQATKGPESAPGAAARVHTLPSSGVSRRSGAAQPFPHRVARKALEISAVIALLVTAAVLTLHGTSYIARALAPRGLIGEIGALRSNASIQPPARAAAIQPAGIPALTVTDSFKTTRDP